jgi:hypothetical protein
MFIAALFIIAKIWSHPRCPKIDDWINNMYIHTRVLFSHKEE